MENQDIKKNQHKDKKRKECSGRRMNLIPKMNDERARQRTSNDDRKEKEFKVKD